VGRGDRPERGNDLGGAQAADGDRRLRRLLEGPHPGRDAARQLHRPQGRREGHPGGSQLPAHGDPGGLAPVGRLHDPQDPRLR
jgi:hypothetical protein